MSQTMLPNSQNDQAESRKTISAIVPVFDEEKTVRGVVEVLLRSSLIDEVVCINDGSTDGSLAILETFAGRISLINLKENHGKGHALAAGIREAKGDIVAFFDADLANLSEMYIGMLLTPMLDGSAIAVLGFPIKDPENQTVLSDLTGERAYYRQDLLPLLSRMETTRFGVEVFLNDAFRERPPEKVPLTGLRGLYKYEKYTRAKAFREYLGAAIEIAGEMGRIHGLLPEDSQIIAGLRDVTDTEELNRRVRRIHSEPVRRLFEKYVLERLRHRHE
jgi:glycosyltransferase involved in cell wall biosynthesis